MNLQVIQKPASINILSYVGDTQGCGTIRVIYPHLLLPHLRYHGYKFVGFYSAYFIRQADYYRNFSFVIFQRAATKSHLALISNFINQVTKTYKTPIIYEIDDLLINIPEWNYASDYYKENEGHIEEIMRKVNGITTSTEKLKEVYSKYNSNIEVIPNHLPKFVWGEIRPKHENYPRTEKERPRILWAGSENHFAVKPDKTGGDFGDELLKYIRGTVEKYQWVICGGIPKELKDLKGKIEYHGWRNIFEYPSFLKSLDVDIAVAPLMQDIFNECKCLIGNTKVISNEGIIDIKDVYPYKHTLYQNKSFEVVSNNIQYTKKKTIKIVTSKGYEIEGTPNHKISKEGIFSRLDELKIKDKVDISFFMYPSNIPYVKEYVPFFLTKKLDSIDHSKLDNNMISTITLNEEWGYFLGLFLGNGNISQSNSVNISCNSEEKDIIERLINFGNKIGVNTFVRKSDKRNKSSICVHYSSRNLMWLLSNKFGFDGGKFKKNLNVPHQIFISPKSVVKSFIQGLFDADGSVTTSSCYFTTKNKKLAQQIQFLLLGFNIQSKISSHWNKIYKRMYYSLFLNRQASEIFYKEIGFINQKKNEKLKNVITKPYSNKYKKWEMNDTIVDIQENINDVYDIEIPNNHYYVANGFISHNSNIKMLEYVAIGVPAVYSKIEPYKHACLQASSDDEIIGHIEALVNDVDLRQRVWKQDYDTVKGQLWWEDNNFYNVRHYINANLKLFGKKVPF